MISNTPRLNRSVSIFSFILIFFLLSGCQTTGLTGKASDGTPSSSVEESEPTYSIFYDQLDHLKELFAAKRYEDAAKLYDKHAAFFKEKWEKSLHELSQLADRLKAKFEPALRLAAGKLSNAPWPAPPAQWQSVKVALQSGQTALRSVPNFGFFDVAEFSLDGRDKVRTGVKALKAKIEQSAAADFAAYDHFSETSFFDLYPLELPRDAFLNDNYSAIVGTLESATTVQLKTFLSHYEEATLGEEKWSALGELFLKAHFRENGVTKPLLKDALAAYSAAKQAGLSPKTIPGAKIGFIEITSRTLLKQRALDFPVEIKADLPVETSKEDLDAIFAVAKDERPDFLVIIDVALAKVDRRISGTRKMPARVLSGYRTEPNPEYNLVQNQINTARMGVQNSAMNKMSADSQYCYGLDCLAKFGSQLAASGRLKDSEVALSNVMTKLSTTPMTIDIPIYQNYKYNLATIKSRKNMTVHYHVIDFQQNRYFKSTFDVNEQNNFEVAYQIQDEDPEKKKHLAKAQLEKDVDTWEDAPSSVNLSSLMDDYSANAGSYVAIPSIAKLRSEMLKDKNTALASYKSNTFEGSTKNDPRFDSVVIVYNPDGSLGSGFYVRPDIVMTNYHVVEEGTFVELKLHNGQETFGKVIAKDVILDLALIKVQSRGIPVRFFSDNELDLGSTVEVIGHPRGYEFSITRGVVSAVRPMATLNINSKRKVLQIQIDAPSSPGNSGGPVFLDDKVISVISWGRVDQGSSNLSFTIHYSEASRFVEETLGG